MVPRQAVNFRQPVATGKESNSNNLTRADLLEVCRWRGMGGFLVRVRSSVSLPLALDLGLAQGLPTILLTGEQFDDRGPVWAQIRDNLGLDADWDRDQLFDALEETSFLSGYPTALFIDALDESRPRTLWRNQLPELLEVLRGHPRLVLCVTFRDSYHTQVLRADLDLPTFTHPGFSDDPFSACEAFFAHYQLQPPIGPLLNPEFENPLFLSIVCQALNSMGESRLPVGWDGMAEVLRALLEHRDRELQEVHPGVGSRAVTRAMLEFAAATTNGMTMTRTRADQLLQESLPASQRSKVELLEYLLHLELLKRAPGPSEGWDVAEDHFMIAFARLRDHLLAEHFASMLESGLDGGELARQVVSAAIEDPGLAEALALALPERLGVELLGLGEENDREFDLIMRAWLRALPWRSTRTLTDPTVEVNLRIALSQGWQYEGLDALLVLALRSGQPLDHRYLHRVLAQWPMPKRDSVWCWYLHERFEERSSYLARLLRAPWQVDVELLDAGVREAWVTTLCWCFAAADRRVRDHATKAAVRLTETAPGIWSTIVQSFADVDDDSSFERVLCAAYGALLRNPEGTVVTELAKVVAEFVFADRGRRWSNALVRDYARGFGELAAHRGSMPVGFPLEYFRPPYESEWPIEVPSEGELTEYATPEGAQRYPRLHGSMDAFAGDFAIYTVRRALEPYVRGIPLDAARRWILQHVIVLGYSPDFHAAYDATMLHRHGGGRARPAWAERIGKKYQRIALNRLVARAADHVDRDGRSWEGDVEPLPSEVLRDIDPSVLLRIEPELVAAPPETPWWQPVSMNFESTRDLSDEAWVGEDDFPEFQELVRPLEDPSRPGQRWRLLDGLFSWNNRENPREYRTPARDVWVKIQGYLLPRPQLRKCWARLRTSDFWAGWMVEGSDVGQVILGEYPWAPSFEGLRADGNTVLGSMDELPFDLQPTANKLTSSFEGDAWQGDALNVRVPSATLVQATATRWDGLGGFVTDAGRRLFVDPAFEAGGPSVLLIDDEALRRVLEEHEAVLIWTVLAERRVVLARQPFSGHKHISRVMHLDGDQIRLSRQPVGEHMNAKQERVIFGPRADAGPRTRTRTRTEHGSRGLSKATIDALRKKVIGPDPASMEHRPFEGSEEEDGP